MKLKYRVIERFRKVYSVASMCKAFEVSRSGYYAWRERQTQEQKDQWLVDLIAACQKKSRQTYPNLLNRSFDQAKPNQFWVTDITYISIPSDMLSYHISPSMSSPGCPYDNAAMENFFGTLKTECLYRAHFTTRTELEQLVTEYVDFYNFERISLKNGLTPVEIRSKAM